MAIRAQLDDVVSSMYCAWWLEDTSRWKAELADVRTLPVEDQRYIREQLYAAIDRRNEQLDAASEVTERTAVPVPRSNFKPGGNAERALRTLNSDRKAVRDSWQAEDRARLLARYREAHAAAVERKEAGDVEGQKLAIARLHEIERQARRLEEGRRSPPLSIYETTPDLLIERNNRQLAEAERTARAIAQAGDGQLPALRTNEEYVYRLTDWDYVDSVAYSTRQLLVHTGGYRTTVEAPELIVLVLAVVGRARRRGIPLFGSGIDIPRRTITIEHCKWEGKLTDHECAMLAELVTATAVALGLTVSWPGRSVWMVAPVEDEAPFRLLLERKALRAWVQAAEA